MKRRRFIGLGLLLVLLTAVVGWFFQKKSKKGFAKWWEPDALSSICGRDKLIELGEMYRQLSEENQREILTDLLLEDFTGPKKDRRKYIKQNIAKDFQSNRTVMIDGWYLSITEARQCALFSLQESSN